MIDERLQVGVRFRRKYRAGLHETRWSTYIVTRRDGMGVRIASWPDGFHGGWAMTTDTGNDIEIITDWVDDYIAQHKGAST